MLIQVTEEHIAKGVKANCRKCPLALAIKSYLRPGFDIEVSFGWVVVRETNETHVYKSVWESKDLPAVTSQFMHEFDSKRKVHPFSFELDVPQQYLKGGV